MRKKIKLAVRHEQSTIPLVEIGFHIIYTNDIERVVNSKAFGEIMPNVEPNWKDHGYYGLTFYDYDLGRVAIIFSQEVTHNVIHHEIHHATMRCGDHIGCKHNHETSEEFYAQVAGYMGEFVYTTLNRWKVPITKFNPSKKKQFMVGVQ